MASSVTVVPTLGHGNLFTQSGVSSGYDAIDFRRQWAAGEREGLISDGSYAVSQRAAGANMSVDVAASTGSGAWIQGDSVALQGLYYAAPHSTTINVDIAAADLTNPRNDLVVLEVKDDTSDASGLNLTRVRVVTGTANASAAVTDAFGVNGTPALPASCVPLAVVRVAAAATTVVTAGIDDRRYRNSGKSIVATTESRTNTAYGLLTTPDRVRNIVLPADGLIFVAYQAVWSESVSSTASAAIFVGANQVQITPSSNAGGGPGGQSAFIGSAGAPIDSSLCSSPLGLSSSAASGAYTGDVTTGQLLAKNNNVSGGGPCAIFAAAGTYDISVQFKSSSGSVTAKNRKLWVWTQAFPA